METKPIPKANANEDDKRKYQEIREYRKSVLNWLRKTVKQCTGVEQFANLDDVDLFQSLRHGVILCKIIQCIEPSILPKIPDERPYPSIFGASMNIAEFLKACRKLGVPHDYLSKATSIVDGKQLSSLVKILTSLALIGNKSGNTPQFSQEDGQRILKIWPHGEAGIEETTEIVSPLQAQKLSYEISTLSAKIDMLDSSHRILFSRVSHVEDITESMEKKYIENTAKLDRLTAGLMDSWDHFSRKISNIEETQTAILKNLEKITEFVMRENTASVLPRKSKDGADQASSIDASTETLDSGHGGSMTDISQPPPTSPPSSPIKEPENSVSRTRQPTNSSEYSLNQSWNSSVKLSRLPSEFGALNLSRSDYLRQESIYELIETERDYVQDLSTLLSCQVADLQRYVMAPDSIKKLIGNIDEIVLVNQHFLSLLDERRKTSLIINKIGDVILQKAKSFETSYAEYSKSYPSCLQYLQQLKSQDEVRLCLEKWNTAPGIKGLSLESYLIKPIQRITKYPLIIRQIQQYTSPEHEDYSLLESALKSCEQVVEAVNQKTNMYGQMEKVIMLKSMIQGFSEINVEGRKLIRDGEVMRLHSIRSRQPYYFILFEDLFVICKPGKVKGQFRVDAQLCPSKILVKSSRDEYKTQTLELLFIGEKREVKIFATHTLADKTAWINSLQNEISRISMKLSTSPNPLDRAISRDDSSLSVSSVNTDISMPESPVSEEKRKSLKLKKRRIVSSASSIRSAKQGFQQRNRIPSFTTSSAPPSHVVDVSTTPASQSFTVDNNIVQQTEKSNNTSAPTSPAKSSSNLPSQSPVTTTALSASVDSSVTSTTPGVTAVAATSNLTNPTEIGQNTLSFPALALSITLYVPQNETQIGFQTNTYIRIIGTSGSERYEVEMNGIKGQIPVSTVILLSRQATPDWDDRLKTCDSDEGTSRLIFWKKQSEEIGRSRTSTMESNDMDLSSITSPELVEINGQIWKQHQAETGQLYYFNTSDKTQCILTLPTHYLIVNPKTGKKFDPWSDVGDVLASIPEEKESSAEPIENKPTKSKGNEKTEEGKRNENELAVPEEIPSHPGWKKFTTQNGESYFLHEESHRVSFHVLPE